MILKHTIFSQHKIITCSKFWVWEKLMFIATCNNYKETTEGQTLVKHAAHTASGQYQDSKFDKRRKEFDLFGEHGREQRVRGTQDVVEEDDEHFDQLLDDVDMATLREEDVDSESGSQVGWRGV